MCIGRICSNAKAAYLLVVCLTTGFPLDISFAYESYTPSPNVLAKNRLCGTYGGLPERKDIHAGMVWINKGPL